MYCRVRPFLPGQKEKQSIVEYVGDDGEIVIMNPAKPGKEGRRLFKFNKVFGQACTQGFQTHFCHAAFLFCFWNVAAPEKTFFADFPQRRCIPTFNHSSNRYSMDTMSAFSLTAKPALEKLTQW